MRSSDWATVVECPSLIRLVVITPVFNEAEHIGLVAASMAAQTRPPDLWVVVDDGSTDHTLELLRRVEPELSFLRVIALARDDGRALDGLAQGRVIRAFNAGWSSIAGDGWDLIAKIDGDIDLPPHYFARVIEEFGRSPRLGMAGGHCAERRSDGSWRPLRIHEHHVPGALTVYSAACLASIGGLPEVLGWDTIDEVSARLHGFETRSFPELEARHLRATGAAAGLLRGQARHGACAWITHYPAYFVALRALRQASQPPRGVSGIAFLYGYVAAALKRTPRLPDAAFRRRMRAELRARLLPRPLRRSVPTPDRGNHG